ncbi:MAG: carbon-nitrogen hydrolase family protein, partial [Actinomycetes bacterium]
MRVAAAQILSGPDPAANLELVRAAVTDAAVQGVDLVVFPEATMRAFGHSLRAVAEPRDGPWATALAEVAAEHDVVVAAGMFTPGPQDRVHNTLRVVGRGIDSAYDKIHLFDAYGFRESDTVAPGADLLVTEVAGVGVGFATCYDLRFPNLFTALADRGAALICVAASWGAGPGKVDQWQLLVRARALDSTCAVVAAGQADPGGPVGPRSAPTGVGHSLVVSARGAVVARLGPEPGLLVAAVDPGA